MSLKDSVRKHAVPLILLALVSIIVFSNTFRNSFIWDDEELIVENRYIRNLKHIPFLFIPQYWNHYHLETRGKYRPVTKVAFALDYFLWKSNPAGYHLTNLLLHISNGILIYFLIYGLAGRSKSEEELSEEDFGRFRFLETVQVVILRLVRRIQGI